jgi:hypothetical protein
MTRRHSLILAALLLCTAPFSLTSCESSTQVVEQHLDSTTVGATDRALFLLNEGQFQHTNGSLDVVIYRANGKDTVIDRNVVTGLGVGNAVHVFGNRAYIIDNSSNKLIVLSADSLKPVGSLSFGLDNPNDIVAISPTRALVTFLFTPRVDIIDLNTLQTVSSIDLSDGSSAAAVLNNKVYITTSSFGGPSHVEIYDLAQQKLTKSIELFTGAGPIATDSAHGKIVIGTVGYFDSTGGRIYWLDATTDNLTDSVNTLSNQASLVFLSGGPKLFVLDGGSPSEVDLAAHSLQPLNIAGNFYNGSYDAKRNEIYLGHNDFTGNKGDMDVFGASDLKKHWTLTAGIAPAHFAFYH